MSITINPNKRKMRKLILAIAFIIVAASVATPRIQAQDDAFRNKSRVVADSIRTKGTRVGQKVAEGTADFVDSIGPRAERFGEKAKVVGDTIVQRSKRAWKVLKGE